MQKLTPQVQAPMNLAGLYSVILHTYMGSGLPGLGVNNTTNIAGMMVQPLLCLMCIQGF